MKPQFVQWVAPDLERGRNIDELMHPWRVAEHVKFGEIVSQFHPVIATITENTPCVGESNEVPPTVNAGFSVQYFRAFRSNVRCAIRTMRSTRNPKNSYSMVRAAWKRHLRTSKFLVQIRLQPLSRIPIQLSQVSTIRNIQAFFSPQLLCGLI